MRTFALRHFISACCLAAAAVAAHAAPVNAPPPELNPQLDKGAQLTRQYCMRCHALPAPPQHTPEQWLSVVLRMEGYMSRQGMAVPDDQSTAAILTYLDSGGN